MVDNQNTAIADGRKLSLSDAEDGNIACQILQAIRMCTVLNNNKVWKFFPDQGNGIEDPKQMRNDQGVHPCPLRPQIVQIQSQIIPDIQEHRGASRLGNGIENSMAIINHHPYSASGRKMQCLQSQKDSTSGMIQEKLIPGRLIRLPEAKGPLARERERNLNPGFHRFFIHWTPFFPSAYNGLFRIYLNRPNSTNSPPNFALNSRTP